MSPIISRSLEVLRRATAPQRPPVGLRSGGYTGGSLVPQAGFLSQLQAYGSVGWLFACVDAISEAVAGVRWHVYQRKADGTRTEVEPPTRGAAPTPGQRLLALWNQVNPFFSRQEFAHTFQQHLELVGEAYWLLVPNGAGEVVEMWPIRPDRITPMAHPTEWLQGYLYQWGGVREVFRPDQLVALRRPNPLDPYRGMGPVQALLTDLDSERYAAQWNRNFFVNSAEHGGIIETSTLGDAEFEQMLLRWRIQHQGVSNAHRVAILENAHWVDRKYTMRDMQFAQLRMVNRDIILGAFRVHPHILGISEGVNRANAEAALWGFMSLVVKPRLERIRDVANERLAPLFASDLEFDYDNPVPHDREMDLRLAVEARKVGAISTNEARELLGLGAREGEDDLTPPITMTGEPTLTKDIGPPGSARLREDMEARWERRLAREAKRLMEHLEENWE